MSYGDGRRPWEDAYYPSDPIAKYGQPHTQHRLLLTYAMRLSHAEDPKMVEHTARYMERAFARIGVVEELEFKVIDVPPFVASWPAEKELHAKAYVTPHDTMRRWLDVKMFEDRRTWQERLADLTDSVTRVAEVKVLDRAYAETPSYSNFTTLMQARSRLRDTDWQHLVGKDQYAPYGQRDDRGQAYWNLTQALQ